MATKTGIEWTDSTWSPLRVRVRKDAAKIAWAKGYDSLVTIAKRMEGHVGPHCEHVSPGCLNCYAGTNNHRCLPANGTGLPYDRRSRDLIEPFVDEKILLQPLGWGPVRVHNWDVYPGSQPPPITVPNLRRRRIFVENQSDIFGEWWPDEMLDQVFAVMALCPQHDFQVLTKRPARMLGYMKKACTEDGGLRIGRAAASLFNGMNLRDRHFSMAEQAAVSNQFEWKELKHVWLGVSVENQKAADERIPLLLETPAAVRFISAEPLLGPIDLRWWTGTYCPHDDSYTEEDTGATICRKCEEEPVLDWVIVGGESGPGAREMQRAWARGLRDQCVAAGVPFLFKQWGAWIPTEDPKIAEARGIPLETCMSFVGRQMKKAPALLDGVAWKQFPEVRHA